MVLKKLTKNQKTGLIIGGALVLGGLIYLWYKRTKKPVVNIPEVKVDKVLKDVFENLTFETNKDVIKEESYPYLDELASTLTEAPEWKLTIVGHTDNVGKDAFNMDLSLRRANSVKKYLVSKGVDESVITTDGKGETMPIASNNTKEGRAKNRRVEFTITKPDNTSSTTIM